MRRPEVSLQNYEAVYDYYENHIQNQQFARFGHYVLGQIFKPKVTYAEDGAAQDAIKATFNEDSRVVLAVNHETELDQYELISLVKREKVFHPFIGNSFMAAKASLFMQPASKGGSVLRWALDEMGGIPVLRMEDIKRQGIEITPEIEAQHHQAILRADDVQLARLIRGSHMGNFPEGTRNRTDHTRVQPLKKGFAHTVLRAANEVGVSIIPMGMYYGEPESYDKLDIPNKYTPNIHIGMPLRVDPALSPEELVGQLHPAMQSCVDVAVRAYLERAA